jgi:hypothetical protein
MEEKPKLNRVIKVTTFRKSNGAVGSKRKNNTGKRATIYQKIIGGNELIVFATEKPNFRELSRDLHGRGGVPQHVSINKNGETHF